MAASMGPGPDVEHHHHHHTGHRWLDVVLGVSAVFISLMSLVLAIQHGKAMERMVEVSSWPYVAVQNANANPDGSPRFVVWITNSGVGPAKVESVELFYDGVAQPGARSLIRAMLKINDPNRTIHFLQSDVVGTVLPARERLNLFDLLPGQVSPEEYQTLREQSSKVEARICYCSVFDECSVADQRLDRRPKPVKVCPVPKTMFGG
jgi:hypothetical protein